MNLITDQDIGVKSKGRYREPWRVATGR